MTSTKTAARRPPPGLKAGGKSLWRATTTAFELSEYELLVLREAARTVDSLDDLQAQLDADGTMAESSQGPRVHPALVELRQQRIALARLFTALQIPLDDDSGRTPRRGGARGVYGIGNAS